MQQPHGEKEVFVSTCPHCGTSSKVSVLETFRPTLCPNCQKQHLATQAIAGADVPSHPAAAKPTVELSNTRLGQIGRYEIQTIVGIGAFGVVYKAFDTSLHRTVALKVPRLSSTSPTMLDDLLREARAAAQLSHPRIVSIYDVDVAQGQPFIVSEFIAGGTLADLLKKEGSLPVRRAVKIIYELAQALHYAHQRGIIHRDIKPANIILDRQGRPQLTDFGMAGPSGDHTPGSKTTLRGTPAYMSPEQALGQHDSIGPASDQYSLGVVLFECVTGQRPSSGAIPAILRQISQEPAPHLRSVNADLPEALDRICERMMAAFSENRFPQMNQVAAALANYLKTAEDSQPGLSGLQHNVRSRRVPLKLFGITGACLLLGTVGMRMFFSDSPTAPIEPVQEAALLSVNPSIVPLPSTPPDIIESPLSRDSTSAVESMPISALLQDELPVLKNESEPPVDALTAVHDIKIEDAIIDAQITYPSLKIPDVLQNDSQFLSDLSRFIELGSSAKLVREAEFLELHRQYNALRSHSAEEPRLDYAMGLVRQKIYPADKAKLTHIPSESDFFRSASKRGGYPFIPAYPVLIEPILASSTNRKDLEEAADMLIELAQAINQPHPWPDASEKMRVVLWMGQIYGFASSGVVKMRLREDILQDRLPRLLDALGERLANDFISSIEATQEQIKVESGNLQEKNNLELQKAIEKANADVLEKNVNQAAVVNHLEVAQSEVDKMKTVLKQEIAQIEEQAVRLEEQRKKLWLRAKPLAELLASRSAELASIESQIQNLNSNPDVAAQPTTLMTAMQNKATLESSLSETQQELNFYNLQDQKIQRQWRQLAADWEIRQRKHQLLNGETDKLNRQLSQTFKSAELQSQDSLAAVSKPADSQRRNQRKLNRLQTWTGTNPADGWNWLQKSLPPPPKLQP